MLLSLIRIYIFTNCLEFFCTFFSRAPCIEACSNYEAYIACVTIQSSHPIYITIAGWNILPCMSAVISCTSQLIQLHNFLLLLLLLLLIPSIRVIIYLYLSGNLSDSSTKCIFSEREFGCDLPLCSKITGNDGYCVTKQHGSVKPEPIGNSYTYHYIH